MRAFRLTDYLLLFYLFGNGYIIADITFAPAGRTSIIRTVLAARTRKMDHWFLFWQPQPTVIPNQTLTSECLIAIHVSHKLIDCLFFCIVLLILKIISIVDLNLGLGLRIWKLFSKEPSSIDPLTRDNIKLLEATSTLAKKADAPLCRMSPPVSNDKDDDVSIPDQLISK